MAPRVGVRDSQSTLYSMATPTEEDTRPKVLIRGQWRKVPDGYPTDASGQLERDQLFIDDLSKQLVAVVARRLSI